jgi:hypothetical protein
MRKYNYEKRNSPSANIGRWLHQGPNKELDGDGRG